MKKLNKNFNEQRKTIEAMLNLCANGSCACDYPDNCNCPVPGNGEYSARLNLYDVTTKAVDQNLKTR